MASKPSMKTRIIRSLESAIAEYSNIDLMENHYTRLAELGAPESLIANSRQRAADMRAELPRMLAYVQEHCAHSDSKTLIWAKVGNGHFTEEALWIVWRA